jgi:hypothetical protein
MMRTFMDDVALEPSAGGAALEPSAGGATVRMSRIVRWVLPDLANRIAHRDGEA